MKGEAESTAFVSRRRQRRSEGTPGEEEALLDAMAGR